MSQDKWNDVEKLVRSPQQPITPPLALSQEQPLGGQKEGLVHKESPKQLARAQDSGDGMDDARQGAL